MNFAKRLGTIFFTENSRRTASVRIVMNDYESDYVELPVKSRNSQQRK